MSEHDEPITIVITEEDVAPLVPESQGRDVSGAVNAASRKVGEAGRIVGVATGTAVQKAWRSEPRKKVTRGLAKGAAVVTRKSSDLVAQAATRQAQQRANALQERIKETDWKEEAKTGTVKGLRWLSQKLSLLAERLIPEKGPADPPADQPR